MKQFREADFYLAFSVSPLGPKTFRKLLHAFKTAEHAWKAREDELKQAGMGPKTLQNFNNFRIQFDIGKYKEILHQKDVVFIASCDKNYPKKLLQLQDLPIGIYAKGNVSLLNGKSLAIGVVGTRKMTAYGRVVTEKIVGELVRNGTVIISGLALGIDAAAHMTTLQNGGSTIAVLGCGVDCCYPKENESLYNKIVEGEGIIISEYPLSQMANKGTFPARNRIISALSDSVLVTEAGLKSGSLITAELALKQGKKVYAVPGPITSITSSGTTQLLKEGAKLISSGADILQDFNIQSQKRIEMIKNKNLSSEEKKIIEVLMREKSTTDELSKCLKIPVVEISVLLSKLEMKSIIKDLGDKTWEIKNID